MSSHGSSSPLSSLSSAPSDTEMPEPTFMLDGTAEVNEDPMESSDIEEQTSKRTKDASPRPEEVLADNPNIAFIVMFRSRFSDAFPARLPHFGPQDIESGIVGPTPSPEVERFLCALLGLVLNRQKPIENGHYGRALEEAISKNKTQWPRDWKGMNPLHGSRTFNSLSPAERLSLLRALILWSLHESDSVSAIMKEAYKQARHDDDLHVPVSVQPWGKDGQKRRYWLIEGRDDTSFRVYRENNPALKKATWWSIAGSIEDLHVLVQKLDGDNAQASKRLAERVRTAIPRFEASEEKRRRREYRVARKAAFTRPEPGFSLYEGRTRGKRMRYTYDDDDGDAEDDSEDLAARRSTRNTDPAPAAESRPTTTLSGRQVRAPAVGFYREILLGGHNTSSRPSPATEGDEPVRASRSGQAGVSRHVVEDDPETPSEGDWDAGDEDDDNERYAGTSDGEDDDEEDASDGADYSDDDHEPKSLIVKLCYRGVPTSTSESLAPTKVSRNGNGTVRAYPTPSASDEGILSGHGQPPPMAAPADRHQNGTLSAMQKQSDTKSGPANGLTHKPTINGLPPNPYAGIGPMKQSQLAFEARSRPAEMGPAPQLPVQQRIAHPASATPALDAPSPQPKASEGPGTFSVELHPPQ